MNDKSTETVQILRQLAQLQGAAALNVVARSYPRLAPAQGGTGLRQHQCDFPCDHVPETLGMPLDADEITITLRGAVGLNVSKPDLKKAIEEKVYGPMLSQGWDVRAYFDAGSQDCFSYQVKVFTSAAS